MIKRLASTLTFSLLLLMKSMAGVTMVQDSISVKPGPEHALIGLEVAQLLEKFNYKKVPLQDSLSKIVFDNLLKSMDEGHHYLLKADVDAFRQSEGQLCQYLKTGNLAPLYNMYNRSVNRYIQSMEYALQQVDAPHNFQLRETYTMTRADLPFFSSEKEHQEHWRKRVKFDLLNLRLAGAETSKKVSEKDKETLRQRYRNIISQTTKTNANDAFQVIMKAFTDAIDPHLAYYNPEFAQAFKENISNTLEGIGVSILMENEILTIKGLVAGGPAFKEKSLRINDRIIAIAQGDDPFEDIIGWRQDAALSKIKGPKGSVVRLKVIPAGLDLSAQPKIVTLTRDKIVIAEESAKKEIKSIKTAEGKDYKIGLIKLPKFYIDFEALRRNDPDYKSTTRDVRLLLDTLREEKVDAVMLDLRNNGGGSLQEVIELMGLFIDTGAVVQIRDANGQIAAGRDEQAGASWNGPFGVLINRFSASASEIFAAAVQDYGRGIVLGSPSYGKGTIQTIIDMGQVINPQNKEMLKKLVAQNGVDTTNQKQEFGQINLTTGKFYRITGSSTQHKGVTPDIVFPSPYTAQKFGEQSYTSALPWDQVTATNFGKMTDLTATIASLDNLHENRIKNAAGYRYLLDDMAEFQKNETIKEVDLHQTQAKKKRDESMSIHRESVNRLLAARHLPLWKKDQPEPKFDADYVLDESLNIMADYIPYHHDQQTVTPQTVGSDADERSLSTLHMEEFKGKIAPYMEKQSALDNWYKGLSKEEQASEEVVNKMKLGYAQAYAQQDSVVRDFIVAYNDSPIALDVLRFYAGSEPQYDKVYPIFQQLSDRWKSSEKGRKYIAELQKMQTLENGRTAPVFSLPDTTGRIVNLRDFRGKYVLIDFWASWCGPCRQENPNVVKAFHTFKDKGFTIIGISLDTEKARGAWLKAIADDHLSAWTQLSFLKHGKDDVTDVYNISSIPYNVLIDREGKIVAKNLRGADLERKLQELL